MSRRRRIARSSRPFRWPLLALSLFALALLGLSLEGPALGGEASREPAPTPVSDTVLPDTAPQPGVSGSAAPAAGGEDELETFVPSERLPADVAVAFPVDI